MSKSHQTYAQQYCPKLNTWSMNHTGPGTKHSYLNKQGPSSQQQQLLSYFYYCLCIRIFFILLTKWFKTGRKLKSYLCLSTVLVKASHGRSRSRLLPQQIELLPKFCSQRFMDYTIVISIKLCEQVLPRRVYFPT